MWCSTRWPSRYGVAVDTIELRVPLRETFGGNAKGHGRHVKQSGGHGQYAVCDIEVEPLPEGSGFEFVDKVVGGSVPRQFIPSVEKGVRAQMEKGVGAGYPVVDIRVTLFDGKAHSVDSSDFAFQMAGGLALREAAAATRVNLLEPVDVVSVLVPDDLVGAVMGDLAGRRGPGARHRQGRRGPHAGQGRDSRGRVDPLRNRSAVAVARRRIVHPVVRALRADARVGRGQGEDDPSEAWTRNHGAPDTSFVVPLRSFLGWSPLFERRVWIISKCGVGTQQKTLAWLDHNDF